MTVVYYMSYFAVIDALKLLNAYFVVVNPQTSIYDVHAYKCATERALISGDINATCIAPGPDANRIEAKDHEVNRKEIMNNTCSA